MGSFNYLLYIIYVISHIQSLFLSVINRRTQSKRDGHETGRCHNSTIRSSHQLTCSWMMILVSVSCRWAVSWYLCREYSTYKWFKNVFSVLIFIWVYIEALDCTSICTENTLWVTCHEKAQIKWSIRHAHSSVLFKTHFS